MKKLAIAIVTLLGILLLNPVYGKCEQIVQFPGLNLQGDTIYLFGHDRLAVGVGTTIAKFYDLAEIRAKAVSDLDDVNLVGIGAGIDIPKWIKRASGTWMLEHVMPSIGIVGLLNLTNDLTFEPGVYLTVLKIEL